MGDKSVCLKAEVLTFSVTNKLHQLKKGELMQRRTFMKYSMVTGATVMFPEMATANWFTKSVKTALYCSRLHPVRFVSGLIFDKVSEVYLEPLAKKAFNHFWNGHSFSKSSLSYYSSLSSISSSGDYEEYKASTVIDGVADYEKYKENQKEKLRLLLTQEIDTRRFDLIRQYLKDEKVKIKLYDRPTYFKVGNDLEVNSFFNVKHLVFNKHEKIHHEKLLELTENTAFGKLIV
jgi:hypothetical protein